MRLNTVSRENTAAADVDVESQASRGLRGRCRRLLAALAVRDGEVYDGVARDRITWYTRLLNAGVEENGIKPVPAELRTETEYNKLFTVFFTCLLCILPYVSPFWAQRRSRLTVRSLATGALGTTTFRLSLGNTSLVIVFFALLTCIPPAFMGIGGYQTGMRQMIQARYSFG